MARGGNTTTVKDVLKSELYFPSFGELCDENGLDYRYWKEDYRTGHWVYTCTWCFIAEITNDEGSQISFLRNRVLVRDRSGRDNIPVLFYPEDGSFDFQELKRGRTICVIQAQRHHFLDLTIGLRIECLNLIKVIPCSLNDLFSLSTFYSDCQNVCWACKKKKDDTTTVELKKCSVCHTAQYCGKDCQVKDWKERHRRWCKGIPEFLKLTKIDYSKYDEDALYDSLTVERKW